MGNKSKTPAAKVPTDLDNPSLDTQIWYMGMAVGTMGGIMPTAILTSLEELRTLKQASDAPRAEG